VFQEVARAGFTSALTGPRGGYRLSRPADQIRLIQVIEALDGQLLPGWCLLSIGDCPGQQTCGVRALIGEAELTFYRFFEKHTIASLARRMAFPDGERRLHRRQRSGLLIEVVGPRTERSRLRCDAEQGIPPEALQQIVAACGEAAIPAVSELAF